jgi:hypothetical protein
MRSPRPGKWSTLAEVALSPLVWFNFQSFAIASGRLGHRVIFPLADQRPMRGAPGKSVTSCDHFSRFPRISLNHD